VNLGQLLARDQRIQLLTACGLQQQSAEVKAELFGQVAVALQQMGVTAEQPLQACFVPGRIEVLGKHTDYAGGHTLVTAVEQGFCLAACPRADARIRVRAAASGEQVDFALDPQLEATHGHWSNYPMTVARRLARNFADARRGADIAFISDLPPASGMSSSSAMMIATYLALAAINDLESTAEYQRNIQDRLSLAAYLGTVENGQTCGELVGDKGVGTFGGSEDHTAILCSRAGHLGQFGYCPARLERYIAMPQEHVFAVGFSGVVAEKTGAAQELYNRASGLVQAAVKVWRQHSGSTAIYLEDVLSSGSQAAAQLRDVLANAEADGYSASELVQRLDHYVAENQEIVGPAGDALASGDLSAFGVLVDRSQELTDTLLGNQVPETIGLARLARQHGALAASGFGAGFGGSVWALVSSARAEEFLAAWSSSYSESFAQAAGKARFFTTQAGPSAFELEN
jgi:galactokinase